MNGLGRQNTTLEKVRQSIFLLVTLILGATIMPAADTPSIVKAKEELARVKELSAIGAVSRARLQQAEENLADAQDDETLRQLLFGTVGVESLNETEVKRLLSAAQNRVDRVARRYQDQSELVRQGVLPKSHMTEFERQLAERRLTLQLAESRAHIFEDLLNMAKAEEFFTEDTPANEPKPLVESYVGSGVFKEAHLAYIENAFEKQFKKPLPVSARGQTHLHTSLGFDHSGRVDVGVNPDEQEGIWLRQTLETLRVPFIALRSSIPGKSTAPHIHIGLPSNRLKTADTVSGSGLH